MITFKHKENWKNRREGKTKNRRSFLTLFQTQRKVETEEGKNTIRRPVATKQTKKII